MYWPESFDARPTKITTQPKNSKKVHWRWQRTTSGICSLRITARWSIPESQSDKFLTLCILARTILQLSRYELACWKERANTSRTTPPGGKLYCMFAAVKTLTSITGTCFRRLTFTNSNLQIESPISLQSCHCTCLNRNWALTRRSILLPINSCSKAGKRAQCIEVTHGCSGPSLMTLCSPG
jgi:hypothetical protein